MENTISGMCVSGCAGRWTGTNGRCNIGKKRLSTTKVHLWKYIVAGILEHTFNEQTKVCETRGKIAFDKNQFEFFPFFN